MKPFYEKDGMVIYHGDCRDVWDGLDIVDLVMTDPPYGIGADKGIGGDNKAFSRHYKGDWDKTTLDQDVYDDCRAMGKYACIWGGNYYENPPSSSWLVWDKQNTGNFADCELAWTNYGCAVRIVRHLWNGMIRKNKEERFHPTQKPIDVIKWAIDLAPKSDTILDPFMGSGTTLRAAKDLGRKCIGIDIEEKYCEIAAKRLGQEVFDFSPQRGDEG